MRSVSKQAVLAAIALTCATSIAFAQAKPAAKLDVGAMEYRESCAACHGKAGKGDGSYRPWLVKSPTDLTTLAKRNGGVFPVRRVYEMIDGRESIDAHGTRDMPIWGTRYSAEAGSYYYWAEVPGPYDTEAFVRGRILGLVEYINRLQVK